MSCPFKCLVTEGKELSGDTWFLDFVSFAQRESGKRGNEGVVSSP